jgi:hypothetical protein
MDSPLDKLPKLESATVQDMLKVVRKAQNNARRIIADAAATEASSKSARARDAVYADILQTYQDATGPLDKHFKRLVSTAAKLGNKEAAVQVGSGADVVMFNEERLARYWAYVAPENSKSLAAVFTDSMGQNAITQLRNAFVDTFRESGIEGWSGKEMQKQLQMKWDAVAGDKAAYRFVDRSGRVWENARYLQMSVRTASTRVSRDSFIDTMTQAGVQFARISDDSAGECEICARWAGKIIAMGGTDPDFPSYQDSLDDGMWHPNCTHRLDMVTPEEVESQRGK